MEVETAFAMVTSLGVGGKAKSVESMRYVQN
jgi:hypothetical protein